MTRRAVLDSRRPGISGFAYSFYSQTGPIRFDRLASVAVLRTPALSSTLSVRGLIRLVSPARLAASGTPGARHFSPPPSRFARAMDKQKPEVRSTSAEMITPARESFGRYFGRGLEHDSRRKIALERDAVSRQRMVGQTGRHEHGACPSARGNLRAEGRLGMRGCRAGAAGSRQTVGAAGCP